MGGWGEREGGMGKVRRRRRSVGDVFTVTDREFADYCNVFMINFVN